MDKSNLRVVHIATGNRFELDLGNNRKAVVVYKEQDNKLYLTHSEVPMSMRGEGIGKILVEQTFDIIKEKGLQAVAVCSYVKAVAQRNPKWHGVIEF